jgi:hypothetical protein
MLHLVSVSPPWYSHRQLIYTLRISARVPLSLTLFLSVGSLRCTQPWSSSGPSSSSISQLSPAMPKRVEFNDELIPSEMYLPRVFGLSSTRIIGIVHTIWTIVHFAFRDSRGLSGRWFISRSAGAALGITPAPGPVLSR